MAETAKIANFILKDGQGNIQHIRSFTENDVTKIKQALTDIETLKQQFASILTIPISLIWLLVPTTLCLSMLPVSS